MNSFSDWLVNELTIRNWSQSDLAKKSKLSKQSISQLVNEIRGPGPEAVTAIAEAMMLDPIYVMRVAGLLPQERSEPNSTIGEIIQLVERIPVREQQHLLEIVRAYTRRYLPEQNHPPE